MGVICGMIVIQTRRGVKMGIYLSGLGHGWT